MFGIKKAFYDRPVTLVDENTINNYRVVVANLASILEKNGSKTFVISGITKNDKKSELAINIAITFAKSEKKILFINYDDSFEIPKDLDCIETLEVSEKEDVADIAKKKEADYDYVIINVKNVNDKVNNINVAKNVDGIVFIINKLFSKKQDFSKILGDFAHVNVCILGAIFIDAE